MFGFIKAYFEKRREIRRKQRVSTAKVFLDKYYKPIPVEVPKKEVQIPVEILKKEVRKEKPQAALYKKIEPAPKAKEKEKQVQHSVLNEPSHSSESSEESTFRFSISYDPPLRNEAAAERRYSIVSTLRETHHRVDFDHFKTHQATILDFLNEQKEETFVSALFRHMRCKGYTAPTIYKRANIDKRHYSKIISNTFTPPTKDVAIALSFALRLSFNETQDFISKAGYTLTHSNERDVLIEYCLKEKIYNIHEVNFILSEFKQKALGEK